MWILDRQQDTLITTADVLYCVLCTVYSSNMILGILFRAAVQICIYIWSKYKYKTMRACMKTVKHSVATFYAWTQERPAS